MKKIKFVGDFADMADILGRHVGCRRPFSRKTADTCRHVSALLADKPIFSRKMSAQMSADRKMSAVILAPTPLPPLEINLSAVGIENSILHYLLDRIYFVKNNPDHLYKTKLIEKCMYKYPNFRYEFL